VVEEAPGAVRRVLPFVARWTPFLVPPLYFLLVLSVQPSDRLGPSDSLPKPFRGLYDDYDFAAMALRGLNASLGRTAGRLDNPDDLLDPDEYNKLLDDPAVPLQPRYFLEYPHAALLLFRLPFLVPVQYAEIPAALCDGNYGNLVLHEPRNDAERDLWRRFRLATRFYLAVMIFCQLALMATLRAGYDSTRQLASGGWLLLLPGAIYFIAYRFDVIPALLTALSLACLGRRLPILAGAFLGAATMVKVYPVLLAPLVFRYLWPDRRARWAWLGAYAATIAAFLLPELLCSGWEAVAAPYKFQLSRAPMLWTVYNYILPKRLEENDLLGRGFRLGCLFLTLALLSWRAVPDLATLLRHGAVILIVFVSLAVFYSPQWIVWLAPLLLPLAPRDRWLTVLIVALDLVTFLTWPLRPDMWFEYTDWISIDTGAMIRDAAVYGRFVVLAVLVIVLLMPRRRAVPIV
jgi:hypothetical protein